MKYYFEYDTLLLLNKVLKWQNIFIRLHFHFTFNMMFLRRVSSKTACSFRLISTDSSNVNPESLFEEKIDAIIPPCSLSFRLKDIQILMYIFVSN